MTTAPRPYAGLAEQPGARPENSGAVSASFEFFIRFRQTRIEQAAEAGIAGNGRGAGPAAQTSRSAVRRAGHAAAVPGAPPRITVGPTRAVPGHGTHADAPTCPDERGNGVIHKRLVGTGNTGGFTGYRKGGLEPFRGLVTLYRRAIDRISTFAVRFPDHAAPEKQPAGLAAPARGRPDGGRRSTRPGSLDPARPPDPDPTAVGAPAGARPDSDPGRGAGHSAEARR